jgi:hypothetical protein
MLYKWNWRIEEGIEPGAKVDSKKAMKRLSWPNCRTRRCLAQRPSPFPVPRVIEGLVVASKLAEGLVRQASGAGVAAGD